MRNSMFVVFFPLAIYKLSECSNRVAYNIQKSIRKAP